MSKAIGAIAVAALLVSTVTLVLVLLPSKEPDQSWCSYNESAQTYPIDTNITITKHSIPFATTQMGQVFIQFSYSGSLMTLGWLGVWIELDGQTVLFFSISGGPLFSGEQSTTVPSLSQRAHVVTVIIQGNLALNYLNNSLLCVTYTPT